MVKIKNGNVITIVRIEAFNNIYKPKGWTIVEESVKSELDCELNEKGLVNEKQQNAYIHAKKEKSKRHFDDGLFKGE